MFAWGNPRRVGCFAQAVSWHTVKDLDYWPPLRLGQSTVGQDGEQLSGYPVTSERKVSNLSGCELKY